MEWNFESHTPIRKLKKWQVSSYVSPNTKLKKYRQNCIVPEEICNNYTCSICLCECYRGGKLIWGRCGHIYHLSCFYQCLNNRYSRNFEEDFLCPTCRKAWENKSLIKIY